MTTRYLPLALRAYAEAPAAKPMKARPPRPSPYSLVIDCETTTHLEQELRFGFYRVYNGLELEDEGAFSGFLQPHESKTLEDYCAKHGLTYMVLNEWVEKVFYEFGYRLHGQVVGFNLPFDLSRLAQRWAVSRGSMSGGWTFYLADDTAATPPLQIKSLSHHRAVIRFRSRWADRAPRSMRKRELPVRPYRGHFVDVHTFAHCLLGSSFTLSELCKTLGVKHGKLITKGHGKLTPAYLKYAERDPLATWECFLKLREQLRGSGLKVEPSSLYSEAGVAKAILRQMGVKPWRQLQPGFHPELLGIIWSTYYAGRSELHLRREHRPSVYLDFTSQYPAIAALMGLWRYLTATGIEVSE
ncbi:MAG: hypothetical protein KGJ45_11420, partial [Elusimicrobia bacterium]|nr:hypothetical protein [Elusimicrobiota bacterium]